MRTLLILTQFATKILFSKKTIRVIPVSFIARKHIMGKYALLLQERNEESHV